MAIVFLLLPLSIALAAAAIGAFIWATKSGQFDDFDTPPNRILHDDEPRAALPESQGSGEEPVSIPERNINE